MDSTMTTTLGQVMEATSNELCIFDQNIKGLMKEFSASNQCNNSSGSGSEDSRGSRENASVILQKFRYVPFCCFFLSM